MQTNTTRFFAERDEIKANPMLETFRKGRFWALFMIILYVALFVISFLLAVSRGQLAPGNTIPPMPPMWISIMGISALNFATNSVQGRYWKRIEQQRFEIVRGHRMLLAAEPPMLNVASTQLPLTIKWRYSRKFLLLLTGSSLLIALFLAGSWSLNGPWFFTSNASLFFLTSFSILVGILFLVIILIVNFGAKRQWVKVTEDGITTRNGWETSTVRWEEARLLTMYHTYGAQKSEAAMTYELSSATDIVRWTWVRHKTYFVNQEPMVPLAEHSRQMQELLALVEAKTGLALYYLRIFSIIRGKVASEC